MTDVEAPARTDQPPSEICDLALASTQLGILGLVELERSTTAYHMPVMIELDRRLDWSRLQTALDEMVSRHEVLRSVVAGHDVDLVQRVFRRSAVSVERVDAGPDPAGRLAGFALAPFDHRDGPPVRVGWSPRLEGPGCLVVLVASHALLDGPSLQILLEEINAIYEGRTVVEASDLDIGDVLIWRQEEGIAPDDLEYWRAALTELPALWPPGPVDRMQAPAVSVGAGRVVVPVDREVVHRLEARARSWGATLMSTCAAAWSMVLAQRFLQTQVTMLMPVGGRRLPELERVVGNLTSVLPVSWDVARGDSLELVSGRALRACAQALAHASPALPDLVSDLNPPRVPGRQAWSDVLFAFNEIPELRTWCGTPARRLDVPLRHAKSDLCLDVRHEGHDLVLCLEFRTDLVSVAEAESLVAAMSAVLESGDAATVPAPASPPAEARSGRVSAGAGSTDKDHRALLEQLHDWCRELLPERGTEVDDEDDLFVNGVDSLGLLRLVAHARRAGWTVSTRMVFEEPSLLGIVRAAARDQGTGTAPADCAVAHTGTRRATATERRMWLLQEVEKASTSAYLVPVVMRVRGDLDLRVLRAAFKLLGERHFALRTTIAPAPDGTLLATVLPDAQLDLEEHWPVDDPGVLARDQLSRGFDVTRLPLARASATRRGADEWWVVATVHHLAIDDRSGAEMVEDLWRVYDDLHHGRRPEPLPGPVAVREPEDVDPESLGFWASHLADVDPAARLLPDVELAADPLLAPGHVLVGNEVRFRVGPATARELRARLSPRGSTSFVALVTAVGLVQSAHASEPVSCVAVPWSASAGHHGPAHGNRTNTVPVPVRTGAAGEGWALLDAVRSDLLAGLAHGDVPFEDISEAWRSDEREGPLFRVMATWQDATPAELTPAGLRVVIEHQEVGLQKFDLTVVAGADPAGGWSCTVRFDPGTVGAPLAARWARDLEATLTRFATGSVGLDVVAPEERALLRSAERRDPGDWPVDVGLHELVDRTLRRDPDRVALRVLDRDGDVSDRLSAGEVDRRTRVVQARLLAAGVVRGDLVGLLLPRGADLVVAELAVMRVGAAIVPLPCDGPEGRTEAMVAVARCAALCAEQPVAWWSGPLVSPVDDGSDPELAAVPVRAGDVAYVMFTSGSTGTPKGVPVDHGSIVNNLSWMQDEWPLGAGDRLLWKTVETFDVSVKEIFWPLLAGAELLVSGRGLENDAGRITAVVERHAVSVIHLVPSLLDVVLEAAQRLRRELSSLRLVMCGAEVVRPAAARRLCATTDARMLHLYGPTEAAIAVTGWAGEVPESGARIPLGVPMPGSRVVVRAPDLVEAPRCAVGELWIGGIPLGRGYLGCVRETAVRFLPDPEGPPGSRMYRTGDLGRVREDLLLEVRGRTDDQVKIRGIRVELGEVESALRALPGVDAAAARWWAEDADGHGMPALLVGYVAGAGLDQASLVAQLRSRLPAAMVPQRVLVLPTLPLGRTHKIDRAKLPHPGQDSTVDPRGEPPRSVELARIWADLLGLGEVHRRQEFRTSGGHSLTAAELSLRIQSELHREVSVGDVLAHPDYGDLEDLVLARGVSVLEPIPRLDRSALADP